MVKVIKEQIFFSEVTIVKIFVTAPQGVEYFSKDDYY